MRGLLHIPVTIMLFLGGLLLKLLVFPNTGLGDVFSLLRYFPYTSSPILDLERPDGAGSGPQMCSLQYLKAVHHQGSGERVRTWTPTISSAASSFD